MSSPIRTITETPDWLRRLRASKGFPDTDDTDLRGFLSRLYKKADRGTCTDLALTAKRPDLDKSADSEMMHGCDNAERFYMENTRKVSTDSDKIPWSFLLSWTVKRRRTVKKINRELKTARILKRKRTVRLVNQEPKPGDRVEVEEKCDLDLSGSSKTEVTIIDTSNPCGISEKMYRRKNVWEVGDKKGKGLLSRNRLNRNKTLNDNGDGDVEKKKFQLCSSSKSLVAAERGDVKKKRGQLCNSSESAQISKDKGIMRETG